MLHVLLLIGIGSLLLYAGAEALVRGSASLALRLGVTPLAVGLVVVAFGTSSPELTVSIKAALAGNSAISLGNVIGSNICNIALILGLAALVRPIRVQVQVVRREVPIMIGVTALLWLFLLDGTLSRLEGSILILGLLGYVVFSFISARREHSRLQVSNGTEDVSGMSRHLWLDVLLVVGGLGVLILGTDIFLDGALSLAGLLGLSQAVIGLSVVAVGTSLPELATSIVASIRNEGDIAVGNVVGSNVFNILAILGIAALIMPLRATGFQVQDYLILMATSVAVLPLMRTDWRLDRWEGALLLGAYIFYIWSLVP